MFATALVAVLVTIRFIGPFGFAFVCLASFDLIVLGIRQHEFPYRKVQFVRPSSESEYYEQFNPKPKTAIMFAFVALLLYLLCWLAGVFAAPGKLPQSGILITEIVFTVLGVFLTFRSRIMANSKIQICFTWLPVSCWGLQSIILLGHGIQIS